MAAVAALAAAFLLAALALLQRPLLAALLPVLIMAGLIYAQPFLNPQTPEPGRYTQVTATVGGDPMPRDDGRVALWLTDVSLNGARQPGKAYLTLQADSGFTADQFFDGAALMFSGSTYIPAGKQNEYDFDFRMWLLQNGAAFGISSVKELRVLNTPDTAPWTDWGARIRGLCAARFQALMGDTGSLAMAMLLGAKDGLSEDEQAAFQSAGVSHLMSVSGLHVALLMGALNGLLTALSLRRSIRLPAMILLVALYCALTGFSPAAVRATAMIVLWLLSQAAGRRPDPLATLSAAAIMVLLLNPLDLFSAGFTLSFSAMAGIMLLGPRLRALASLPRKAKPTRRKTGALRRTLLKVFGKPTELVGMSFAAQAGVLLPVAETFHRVPLYGLLFNLLAVPLAGLLLPLYAVTLLVSLLPLVGGALGTLPALWRRVAASCCCGWSACRRSCRLRRCVLRRRRYGPMRRLPWRSSRSAAMCAQAGQNGWQRSGLRLRSRLRARCSPNPPTCATTSWRWAGRRGAADRRAQDRCHRRGALRLRDGKPAAGREPRFGRAGADAPARGSRGGRCTAARGRHLHPARLPAVTARDAQAGDEGYDVLQMLAESGVPLSYLTAGDTLTLRTASIAVQWPEAGGLRAGRDENDDSLATLIRMGGVRILSMGDVSGLYERYAAAVCDVLKVGHHGSNAGTGDDFLAAAHPAFAIVTCRDGAALPGAETMERLRAHGAAALRTDETGEIVIEAMRQGYRVTTYKTGWMHGS